MFTEDRSDHISVPGTSFSDDRGAVVVRGFCDVGDVPGVVSLVLLDHAYKYIRTLCTRRTHKPMFSCWVHPVPVCCFLSVASDTADVPHRQTKLGRAVNRERPTWLATFKTIVSLRIPHTGAIIRIINDVINT